jgi:hypothetical protein
MCQADVALFLNSATSSAAICEHQKCIDNGANDQSDWINPAVCADAEIQTFASAKQQRQQQQ